MRSLLVLASLSGVAAAAPSGRCVIEQLPAPAPPPAAAPPCHRPSATNALAVRAAITKRYLKKHERGKVEVAFGCDGLAPGIREIVIESGGGHGGTLALWRARRGAGPSYDVRGIVYAGASMVRAARSPPFELASGRAAVPDLGFVRAALSASVREVEPPPRPGTVHVGSFSTSSRDFHALVRLVDDDGRVLERRYTGYAGSSGQDVYLGLEAALGALDRITTIAPAGGTPTAGDRQLFAERFAAAVPHFDDAFAWWVMERYVDLARYLGSPATIPGLLTRLTFATPDRSKVDAREGAVDALARITGWDARTGATIEQAAARYLVECKSK